MRQKSPAPPGGHAAVSEELERRTQASVGQLLMKAGRLFNEQAIDRLQRQGVTGIRIAHTVLFPHLSLEGVRLTELAEKVGSSKQAVGQLVSELEVLGVVKREPDPEDGRAKRVMFTDHGIAALFHGLGVLGEMEAELARRVGADLMARLGADLAVLIEALQQRTDV